MLSAWLHAYKALACDRLSRSTRQDFPPLSPISPRQVGHSWPRLLPSYESSNYALVLSILFEMGRGLSEHFQGVLGSDAEITVGQPWQ